MLRLGNRIMGACFQAPHATPRQRQMERQCSLIKFIFQYAPVTRSHQFTYIYKVKQYNMTLYSIIININLSNVQKREKKTVCSF